MKHLHGFKNKNPKGKDLNIFVRFGGLDLKNQDGYSKDPKTFHAPPAPRGFYAMPKVAQELFLIGSIDSFQPGVVPKWKDEYDNEEGFEKWEKRRKKSISAIRKEFRKSDGNIWHHLGDYVDLNEIIDSHGSWVKTDINTWKKAFSKMSLKHRYGEDMFAISDINKSRGITGYYSKDHCEVFFDEKV
jgi:hypothetical protein